MNTREDLVFREYLATERTDLAIDRTLISYLRTAMTMVVVGVSFMKLFKEHLFNYLGTIIMLISIGVIVVGIYRSYKLKIKLNKIFKK